LIRDFERKSTTLGGYGRGIPLALVMCDWKSGREFELLFNRFATLEELRIAVAEKVDKPLQCVRLVTRQNTLFDDIEYTMTLDDLNFDERCYIFKFFIQESLDSGTGFDVYQEPKSQVLATFVCACQPICIKVLI
jgi:hypothetical protein